MVTWLTEPTKETLAKSVEMPKIEVIQYDGYTFIGKKSVAPNNLHEPYELTVWLYPCGHANNRELYMKAKIGCYLKCQDI